MPARIACPNQSCRVSVTVAEHLLSETVRCPKCRQSFRATETAAPAASNTAVGSQSLPTGPAAPLQTVGRFKIKTVLGAGAFGTVYRAYDPKLDRDVALKVPHPGTLDSPKRVERFLREAKAAANLNHPHIVPVYEFGQDGPHYYIASAFIEGRTLASAIEENGMAFDRAARLTRELAEALAYAHEQGIVHRDVKPANIMLDKDDRVHLMDFGLAARQAEEARLTNEGGILGTPGYMAPEQAEGKRDVGPSADQYSAGVVLYELLTGRAPFEGPVTAVIHNVIHTKPESPRKVRHDLSHDLETVCLRSMEKSPGDRYGDCHDFSEDLRRWLAGEPVLARPLNKAVQYWRWAKRNPIPAGLSASVALLLTIVAIGSVVAAARVRNEQKNTQSALAQSQEETKRAEWEQERANAKTREAASNLATANAKTSEAASNLATAKEQRDLAAQHAETLEEQLYFNRIMLAHHAKMSNNVLEANRYLDACRAKDRKWEWNYLKRVCETNTTRIHTDNNIRCMAISPDGTIIATALDNGVDTDIRLWDAKNGKTLRSIPIQGKDASLAICPKGKWIACASRPEKDSKTKPYIQICQLTDGNPIWRIEASVVPSTLTVSDDGNLLAFATFDEKYSLTSFKVSVRDTSTGREVQNLHSPHKDIKKLAFSRSGKKIAVWGWNNGLNTKSGLNIWEIASAKQISSDFGPERDVVEISFSKTDKSVFVLCDNGLFSKLAVKSIGNSISAWDVEYGFPEGSNLLPCIAAALAPDGIHYIRSEVNGKISLRDISSDRLIRDFPGRSTAASLFAFSRDMTIIAAAGDNSSSSVDSSEANVINVWDNRKVTTDSSNQPSAPPASLNITTAVSPDNRFIASASIKHDGKPTKILVEIKDGNTGNVLKKVTHNNITGTITKTIVTSSTNFEYSTQDGYDLELVFSPDSTLMACVYAQQFVVWSTSDWGKKLDLPSIHYLASQRMQFSSDSSSIIFPESIGVMRALSPTGRSMGTCSIPKQQTLPLICTGDCWVLGVSNADEWKQERIEVREMAADKLRFSVVSPYYVIAPGSKSVYATLDGKLKKWSLASGAIEYAIDGFEGGISALVFSQDGKQFAASAKQANKILLVNTGTGEILKALVGHRFTPNCLAFSPDGNRLVSGGRGDTDLRLWNTETGRVILNWSDPVNAEIAGVEFTPDGQRLLIRWAYRVTTPGSRHGPVVNNYNIDDALDGSTWIAPRQ